MENETVSFSSSMEAALLGKVLMKPFKYISWHLSLHNILIRQIDSWIPPSIVTESLLPPP